MVAGSYRVSGDNGWLLLELISRNISSQLLWSIKNVALICIFFVAVVVNNVSLGTIVGFGCCCVVQLRFCFSLISVFSAFYSEA